MNNAGLIVLLASSAALAQRAPPGRVQGTPHDLTGGHLDGGSGPCDLCHTPHIANPKGSLWNLEREDRAYRTYSSDTMLARSGQPDGSSKLCLSCHDGSVAPLTRRGDRPVPQAMKTLGVDLSDDHPISVPYATTGSSARLAPPDVAPSGLGRSISADLLDRHGLVQCTSCHDPHGNDLGHFLVIPAEQDRLCRTCHSPREYDLSAHAPSDLAGRVAGCSSCHAAHGGQPETSLLKAPEARLCGDCHPDQARAAAQRSRHGDRAASIGRQSPRAVTCSTCHDAHVVRRRIAYERRLLSDPRDAIRPRRLLPSNETPYNNHDEPSKAAETTGDGFCLRCHDGTWLGATNVRVELQSRGQRTTLFAVGSSNLHAKHAGPDARGAVGCTYCHDAHGSAGTLGVQRGALLYPWLTVREYPYRGKGSCASADAGGKCH